MSQTITPQAKSGLKRLRSPSPDDVAAKRYKTSSSNDSEEDEDEKKMNTHLHLCDAKVSEFCEVMSSAGDSHVLRCKHVDQTQGSSVPCGRLIACDECALVMTRKKYKGWLSRQLSRFNDKRELPKLKEECPFLYNEYLDLKEEVKEHYEEDGLFDLDPHGAAASAMVPFLTHERESVLPDIQTISSEWEHDRKLTWCKECRTMEKTLVTN